MTKKKDIIIGGGKGKFPLRYWLEIKSEKNDSDKEKITIIRFDDEEKIPNIQQEEMYIKTKLIDTNQPFLRAIPRKGQVIIIRKPGKIDIFVSDLKLAEKIIIALKKIKGEWANFSWYTNEELIMLSTISKKRISKKKISRKIAPIIEKTIEKFYRDD